MSNIAPNVTVIAPTIKTAANATDQYHQLRVAAYCRVSTAQEEQLNSYQVQIDYYTNLINKKKEWKLVGIYADEGISGTQTKKRTEFNRMIRMCKQKKIDLILCKSISRFARNTVDCLEYVRQLKELGIGVMFEKENINTLKMTSEFMIALYGSFAQAESESISKNVSWGTQKAFQAGKVRYNFKYLLGYKKGKDGKPEIIPKEADIIKRIFNMYLDGMSLVDIAKRLETDNVPTKFGKTNWNRASILSILKNEKYVGDVLLQKTYTIDCISHKAVKNNGERPKYLVSNAHIPIIDRETYNLVQQELARRSSKRKKSDKTKTEQGKYSSKYALTEIMVCDECGSAYRRVTWNVHGKKRVVWRCISRLDHGNRYCKKSPTLHEDRLQRTIVKAINEHFGCKEDIQRMLENNMKAVISGAQTAELNAAEQRLREIDEARSDYITLISSGSINEDELDLQFQSLYDEEQMLKSRITELTNQNNSESNHNNRIKTWIDEVDSEKCAITEYNDMLVRKSIKCIKVCSKDELIIYFIGDHELKVSME